MELVSEGSLKINALNLKFNDILDRFILRLLVQSISLSILFNEIFFDFDSMGNWFNL